MRFITYTELGRRALRIRSQVLGRSDAFMQRARGGVAAIAREAST